LAPRVRYMPRISAGDPEGPGGGEQVNQTKQVSVLATFGGESEKGRGSYPKEGVYGRKEGSNGIPHCLNDVPTNGGRVCLRTVEPEKRKIQNERRKKRLFGQKKNPPSN